MNQRHPISAQFNPIFGGNRWTAPVLPSACQTPCRSTKNNNCNHEAFVHLYKGRCPVTNFRLPTCVNNYSPFDAFCNWKLNCEICFVASLSNLFVGPTQLNKGSIKVWPFATGCFQVTVLCLHCARWRRIAHLEVNKRHSWSSNLSNLNVNPVPVVVTIGSDNKTKHPCVLSWQPPPLACLHYQPCV